MASLIRRARASSDGARPCTYVALGMQVLTTAPPRLPHRCATVYEALGEGAFSEEAQLAGMQAATMAAAAVVAEQQQQQGQPDVGRGRVAAA